MQLNNFTKEELSNRTNLIRTYYATSALMYLISAFELSMYLGKDPSIAFGHLLALQLLYFELALLNLTMLPTKGKAINYGCSVLGTIQ